MYIYWKKLKNHVDESIEATTSNETFESYMIITSPDLFRLFYKNMGFRKNSRFPERLAHWATCMHLDLFNFFTIHEKQINYFRTSSREIKEFICRYLLPP